MKNDKDLEIIENDFYHFLKTVADNPELFGKQMSKAVGHVLDEITQLKFDNDNLNAGKNITKFTEVCEENKQLKIKNQSILDENNRLARLCQEKDRKIENQRKTLSRLNDLYDEAATSKEINKAVRLASQLKPQIDRLCEITQLEKQSSFIKQEYLRVLTKPQIKELRNKTIFFMDGEIRKMKEVEDDS